MKFWCLESWSLEEKHWLMAGPKNSCFQWLCRSLKGFDFAALNWRSIVWLDAAPWCTLVSCYLCVCPLCITEESRIFWLTFFGQKERFLPPTNWTQVGKLQLWSSAAALGISNKVLQKRCHPIHHRPWVHGSSEMIGRLGEGRSIDTRFP